MRMWTFKVSFSRDPLKFVGWSTGFKALIETSCSDSKLLYLKQYISGEALNVLEGTFYQSDEEVYKHWKKFHGHPFAVQKLSSRPKIRRKDSPKLRIYWFPHLHQKMLWGMCKALKLPDWATTCWNRYVKRWRNKGYNQVSQGLQILWQKHVIGCLPFALTEHIGKAWKGTTTHKSLCSAKISKYV